MASSHPQRPTHASQIFFRFPQCSQSHLSDCLPGFHLPSQFQPSLPKRPLVLAGLSLFLEPLALFQPLPRQVCNPCRALFWAPTPSPSSLVPMPCLNFFPCIPPGPRPLQGSFSWLQSLKHFHFAHQDGVSHALLTYGFPNISNLHSECK